MQFEKFLVSGIEGFSLGQFSHYHYPRIEKVIYNLKDPGKPATIVFWKDGSKTIVKCRRKDRFDKEVGVAMAYMRKIFKSRNEFKRIVKSGQVQR